ncbi:hypothetical protein M758_1G306300 [Ceratodon purpureus]|uniref:Uncharacterized protein n=1 Tax=Ceratodon purpureus TaxID=3225 RepID=A0A8T0JBP6_CERPU|nr:hypothetical protein KC19_1G312500 [Ceratodon purpureus]KAG0632129.1 hypothetical protein M758_1G306300 [Ceratodon purpureus]
MDHNNCNVSFDECAVICSWPVVVRWKFKYTQPPIRHISGVSTIHTFTEADITMDSEFSSPICMDQLMKIVLGVL